MSVCESERACMCVWQVLLRLAAFETDMLITYNLPAPRPHVPHAGTDSVAELWQPAEGGDPEQLSSACVPRSHHDILLAYLLPNTKPLISKLN